MKFSQLFEYHEEKNGTFESNGKIYDINKIFDSVENLPTVYFNISDLDWILKYDNPPISNRTDIDYNIPILVAYEENNFLVVDGVHRLKKIN